MLPGNIEQNRWGRSRAGAAVGLGILLLALVLRLWNIGEVSVSYAELRWLGAAIDKTAIAQEYPASPLYGLVLRASNALFGNAPLVLRLCSVGFAVAGVVGLMAAVSHLFGHTAGWVTGLLLAISPAHIALSRSIGPASLVVGLAAVAFYSMLAAARTRSPARWLFHIVMNAALFFSDPLAVVLVMPQAVSLLSQRYMRGWPFVVWAGAQGVCVWLALRAWTPLPALPLPGTWPEWTTLYARFLPEGGIVPRIDAGLSGVAESAPQWRLGPWFYHHYDFLYTAQGLLFLGIAAALPLVVAWRWLRTLHAPLGNAGGWSAACLLVWWPGLPLLLGIAVVTLSAVVLKGAVVSAVTLGAFALAGAIVGCTPWRAVRALLVVLLLAVFLCRGAIAVAAPLRLDWHAVAQWLEAHRREPPEAPLLTQDTSIAVPIEFAGGPANAVVELEYADIVVAAEARLADWGVFCAVMGWESVYKAAALVAYFDNRGVALSPCVFWGAQPVLAVTGRTTQEFVPGDEENAFSDMPHDAHPRTVYWAGRVLESQGRPEAAVHYYLRAAEHAARDVQLARVLAHALTRLGEGAQARALLGHSPAGDTVMQAISKAETLEMEGALAEALAAYETALAQAPESPELLRRQVELLHALDRPAEAVAAARRLVAVRSAPDTRHLLGRMLLGQGASEEAVQHLRRAFDASVGPGDTIPLDLARALVKSGDAGAVFDLYHELKKRDWSWYQTQVVYGMAVAASGDFLEALEVFQEAILAEPDRGIAYEEAADILRRAVEPEGWVAYWRQIVQQDHEAARAHFMLGMAYAAAQALSPARNHLDRAVSLVPDDPGFRAELAVVLYRLGAYARALKEAEAALAQRPATVRAHVVRIRALLALRRFDAARQAFAEAGQAMGEIPQSLREDVEAAPAAN